MLDSSVSPPIQLGWRQEKTGFNIPINRQLQNYLMVTKWDFLEMEASLNNKSWNESVANFWLSTLSCSEAAVHTHD